MSVTVETLAEYVAELRAEVASVRECLGDRLEVACQLLGERCVDEREAAALRGVSVPTLRRERREARGPAFIRDGKLIRYRVSTLHAYMRAQEVTPQRAPSPTEPHFKNVSRNRTGDDRSDITKDGGGNDREEVA